MVEPDIGTRNGQNRRTNRVGNAFAVPVITRLLMALCLFFDLVKASNTSLWECQSLPAPLHPDILDDLLEPAQAFAREFKDLTQEFDLYMAPSWQYRLIGPDPGATGKQNRTQRAASLDNQLGTHLSTSCMDMLILDDQPKGSMYTPEAHVLLAKELTHPFQSPPNLPMDLNFAA